MSLYDVLDQIVTLLQQRQRLTYRLLKREFALDDETLEDLKDELIYARQVARDEDDRVLVWTGDVATRTEFITTPAVEPDISQEEPPTEVNPRPAASHTPDAERRQLTVMFCDLVDSTALSGQLDPEDLRDVIQAYQVTCTEVMQRYDGHVAQLLGDGLLVYFGYPQAHEDDAQRAIHAGLDMLDAMGVLNQRLEREQGVRLAIRVGIHTGLVVVGEIGGVGRQEQLALGETPNVAARIQGLAEPDTVVTSSTTHQLAQGYFEDEVLGEHQLRGVAAPVVIYRVLQASSAQSRLDVATTRGLTPLVGRESEVALLIDRWRQVQDGLGQVVLLSGEAGIGKSRLVQVLKEHIAVTSHIRLECRSSPYYHHTALYPITDLVQRTLQWQRHDSLHEKLRKLEHALSRYRLPLEETVPLFATLLSLPLSEDRYPPLTWSPQRRRQKTLETIVAILLELAEQQPVFFILEDLHWTDPTTLEFVDLLIDQTPTASIFALLTCRPTFQPTWGLRTHLTPLAVNRLSHTQIAMMAERVTGGKALPDEVLQSIVERADGVPLFVEEMTKAILESGHVQDVNGHYELIASLSSLTIPESLQDALMARLDRLGTAKGVAQLGATIGRNFSYALLQALTAVDEATLQSQLSQLVKAELLYQRGRLPQATYTFKHALIQDAAYQSLLKRTR
jgi:class 3 adenylate cyclase